MGDFNFYGSWEDSLEIIDQILKMEAFKLIVDMSYKEEKVIEVVSSSNIPEELITSYGSLYLWSDNYSIYPILFDKPNKNHYRIINQLESGPLIRVNLPRIFEIDKKNILGRGFIFSTPYFVIPNTNTGYSPPEGLRKTFSKLKTTLQKTMVKKYWTPFKYFPFPNNDSIEPVWIGKKAYERLKSEDLYLLVGKDSLFTFSDLRDEK
jgi:hypothetical protein